MESSILILCWTALSIAFIHTLIGPDHYLPFIMLAKSGRWSVRKTFLVTIGCGVGHVLSSVLLGFVGLFIGIAVSKLEAFEQFRGSMAAWLMISFGLLYALFSIRLLFKNRKHSHSHKHEDGSEHEHSHKHFHSHSHVHRAEGRAITPWALFLIFVFGPCEPLIPLLIYPAAESNMFGVVAVTAIFGAVTIATMLAIVFAGYLGLKQINLKPVERYGHVIAGMVIFSSGLAVQVLGL